VAEVVAPASEVSRRGDAGEGTEVVYEVGLVEVPALQGHVRPLHPLRVLDEAKHPLEALDAAEELGRQPDLFVEEPDEAPLAETGPLRGLRDPQPPGTLRNCAGRWPRRDGALTASSPARVVAEVDDDLHRTGWKAAFARVRRIQAVVLPEHLHEIRERGPGMKVRRNMRSSTPVLRENE
jgi:hypothetical protein